MTTTTPNGATAVTIATELHHVAHLGHDVYEQCPACRAAIMIGMGATVAAVIYGGGNADTLVKWVGTFTTMSEADAYCQTKADAYPGMSVLIVDEFGSYDDGRIAPLATPDPMADQTTWTNMSSAGTFAAVAIGDRFKFAAYGASYVKLDRWRYQLVRHEDGSPVPGMTYNVRERGTDTAVAP